MALNSNPINTKVINETAVGAIGVIGYGVGNIISIEQQVSIIGVGELISIEQDIQLRLSSSVAESLISIEQGVQNTTSGQLISIEQFVRDSSIASHLDRTGWDLILAIGGYTIPSSQIIGMIDIDRTENDAALMRVTILPPTGVQDIEFYHGKSITLDIHTASGIQRVYTGTVDIPEIDIKLETVILQCSDKRTELLNNQLPGIVKTIGVYSPHIFSAPKDTAEEIEQRLTTTPYAVDFDAYGNYTSTSWTPKATADYTFTDSDVYRETPKVEFTSRGRVTNKVNITMQYRYERFHHATRQWQWTSDINDDICKLLVNRYSMTYKSMVDSAIAAAGWPLKGTITHTPIHEGGWYRCGSQTLGWTNIQLFGTTTPVLDANGNQLKDSFGENLYKSSITKAVDYSDIYTMGAVWEATNQWSQNITENFTFTVQAPQSQTQFGSITQDLTYAIDDQSADVGEWEDYKSFRSVSNDLNYNVDQDLKRNEFKVATDVALRQAKNIILGSHRDTRVTVKTFIKPEIDLKHTISVSTDEVVAKGKVFNVKHKLNINTGEATTTTTLVLSRAQGSASDSTLTVPGKISDTPVYNTQTIFLDNHFGLDPTTEAAKKWTGYIGNAVLPNTFWRTNYQEQFIVDVPAVPNELRENRELSTSTSYNVAIPNDALTITFDGKS